MDAAAYPDHVVEVVNGCTLVTTDGTGVASSTTTGMGRGNTTMGIIATGVGNVDANMDIVDTTVGILGVAVSASGRRTLAGVKACSFPSH